MTPAEALEIERHAERIDDPDAWLVAGDAWEEAGDVYRAWYARLRGSGRIIRRAEADAIRTAYERYEEARRAYDPRRYERGGGYTEEDQQAIMRLGGLWRRATNEELGRLEFFDFVTEPPAHLFGYYDDHGAIRTFAGDLLGTITHRGNRRRIGGTGGGSSGARYPRSEGTLIEYVTVRGENGYWYHGTCNLETGTYCRLRRGKRWVGATG